MPPAPVVPPAPVWPLVFIGPPPLSGRLLADSIAAHYGLVAGLPDDYQNPPDNWQQRWPVSPGWISLMPGRLPGLRAWLTTDSLDTDTHSDEATDYSFRLHYPAFAGPRADSLRRHLGNISGLPAELADVRRQRLYDAPEPRQPWPEDEEEERPSDCEREETNWLDCFTLGAYVLGSDTLISTGGSTYYSGHCVHGNVQQVQATYSLGRQRLVSFDDLFRPELYHALRRTVAAYVLWNKQWNWRQSQRNAWPPYPRTNDQLTWPLKYWPPRREQDSLKELSRWRVEEQKLRRPDLPLSWHYDTYAGSFSGGAPGDNFYFAATGVVFVIGYDLGSWQLLLPYAALEPYLCDPNDESVSHQPR